MIRLCSHILSLLLIAGVAIGGFSQPAGREVVTQPAEWFAVTSMIKVHDRVSVMAEGQFRYVKNFEPMQFQLRTGVEVTLNKHWSVVPVGYVYTWNERYGEQPARFVNHEHRFWEQVTFKHAIGRFNISHRGRLEQRHIQVHSESDGHVIDHGYDQFLNRVRYRFMANIPLNNPAMDAKTVYASLYDEVFYSWGKGITFEEPDQNRIFAGAGYQFTKLVSMQAGFYYQMLIKSNGTMQENNVGFQVQVNYNFDFTKAE
jgi:hypothetical protein